MPSAYSKKRKRTPSSCWQALPSFTDASATVSSALFGARRLPELKDLYQDTISQCNRSTTTMVLHAALPSGGGKRSSRHLRRRTNAHQKRRFHRPSASLTTTVTTACRRKVRRHVCVPHWQPWQEPQEAHKKKNSTNTTLWMSTHLWHVKRCHMANLFGWSIPWMHTNRGARPVLRHMLQKTNDDSKCTLQDITWERQALTLTIDFHDSNTTVTTSTEQQHHVLLMQLRRITPFLNGDTFNRRCSPNQHLLSVEESSLLYRLDQFPAGAVGPALWRMTPHDNASWRLEVRVHPSMRSTTWQILEAWKQTLQTQTEDAPVPTIQWCVTTDDRKCCCFRLRGKESTTLLQEVLMMTEHDNRDATHTFSSLLDDPNICHGTIVQIHTRSLSSSSTTLTTAKHHSTTAATTSAVSEQPSQPSAANLQQETLELVRQCPRPSVDEKDDCVANQAMAGWEIYCHPTVAHELWMQFVLNAQCLVIGMVEEAHLAMECEPPLLVFPRDYVDTPTGKAYWQGSSEKTSLTNDDDDDGIRRQSEWSRLRRMYEGGWGRVRVNDTTPLCQIDWSKHLLANDVRQETASDDKEAEAPVIVVRGTFGDPFAEALSRVAQIPTHSQDNPTARPRRRNRRKVRPSTATTHPLSIGAKERIQREMTTQTLLQSLSSLPAVLMCHVCPTQGGVVTPGMTIAFFPSTTADKAGDSIVSMGHVTAGCFSRSRGACHGIGAVSARAWLEVLVLSPSQTSKRSTPVRVVPLLNGQRELQLLVHLGSFTAAENRHIVSSTKRKRKEEPPQHKAGMVWIEATLSLLLLAS